MLLDNFNNVEDKLYDYPWSVPKRWAVAHWLQDEIATVLATNGMFKLQESPDIFNQTNELCWVLNKRMNKEFIYEIPGALQDNPEACAELRRYLEGDCDTPELREANMRLWVSLDAYDTGDHAQSDGGPSDSDSMDELLELIAARRALPPDTDEDDA